MSDNGHRVRIIEKFLKSSVNFSDLDILELILFYSIPRKNTKEIAKKILERSSNLLDLFSNSHFLKNIEGFGQKSQCFFKIIYEITLRIQKEKIKNTQYVNCFDDIVNYLKLELSTKNSEIFFILYLNKKNEIIDTESLGEGNVDEISINPRKLLSRVIEKAATSVIIAHNHPSGDPNASKEDILLTRNLNKLLNSIDVNLLDHIIIGGSQFLSFRKNNILF